MDLNKIPRGISLDLVTAAYIVCRTIRSVLIILSLASHDVQTFFKS